jgi:hypothetical protein
MKLALCCFFEGIGFIVCAKEGQPVGTIVSGRDTARALLKTVEIHPELSNVFDVLASADIPEVATAPDVRYEAPFVRSINELIQDIGGDVDQAVHYGNTQPNGTLPGSFLQNEWPAKEGAICYRTPDGIHGLDVFASKAQGVNNLCNLGWLTPDVRHIYSWMIQESALPSESDQCLLRITGPLALLVNGAMNMRRHMDQAN